MEDYKRIFSSNLYELRRQNGITQAELGERLNYSDKAVSKWERGECVPDIAVLIQLAEMFGVTVDYLVNAHNDPVSVPNISHYKKHNRIIIALLSVALVFLIATILYVAFGLLQIFPLNKLWLIYIYAIPAASVVLIVFYSIWGRGGLNFAIITLLVWSMLFGIYYTFSFENLWMIFILGIPAQIIIFLWANLKTNKKTKNAKKR
jgi:transcriptional regulator with XRE-family HTH domain